MKRTTKTVYASDKNRALLVIQGGRASVEYQTDYLTADELDELATACQAAAEELRSIAAANTNDGTPAVTG